MELITVNSNIEDQIISEKEITMSKGTFIESNTQQVSLHHLKMESIIPHFIDNEPSISHAQFIEATKEVVSSYFVEERVLEPNIRASHVIKGRVPSAIGKKRQSIINDVLL